MESNNKAQALAKRFYRVHYVWRMTTPFWMFRDVASGTREQQSANYRFNRSRRNVLPLYIVQWIGIAVAFMLMTQILSNLMLYTAEQPMFHLCATLFCMSAGIAFACSCVVIALLSVSYLYLTHIRE
jgi:hypothetical protein